MRAETVGGVQFLQILHVEVSETVELTHRKQQFDVGQGNRMLAVIFRAVDAERPRRDALSNVASQTVLAEGVRAGLPAEVGAQTVADGTHHRSTHSQGLNLHGQELPPWFYSHQLTLLESL